MGDHLCLSMNAKKKKQILGKKTRPRERKTNRNRCERGRDNDILTIETSECVLYQLLKSILFERARPSDRKKYENERN